MPGLPQWNYLFAIGTIFSLLDAYNIGANDVANSWATSISSKSLTMRQALLAAGVFEFLGAVTVGARVSSTIKNSIIPLSTFQGNAGVQLLAFTCAITASATWLMFCTYMTFPVSTTYSIVSSIAGVGVATGGAGAVNWGWGGGSGLGAIWAGLIIAPSLAGGFGACVYMLIKFVVLMRKSNTVQWAIFTGPFFFFTTASVATMSIIYKGSPSLGLGNMGPTKTALAIVLTGLVIATLAFVFWVPYVYAKTVKKDYTVKWYHFFTGPLLWKRVPPADAQERSAVTNYDHTRPENLPTAGQETVVASSSDSDIVSDDKLEGGNVSGLPKESNQQEAAAAPKPSLLQRQVETLNKHPLEEGGWYEPRNLKIIIKYRLIPSIIKTLTYSSEFDIHAAQRGVAGSKEGLHMDKVYASAVHYPNEVEHAYSFIQVLTACTASFAHGANDVGNAIGPWSAIYHTWSTGTTLTSRTNVPIWMLVVGAIMIVIGLATYGHNIIRVLGNKITYISPSRGASMELGAAITVILASQYGIPVSTTMCITGATVGVGLCNGDYKAVNWKAVGWIYAGWLLTIPLAGTLAGCLMGIVLNAPHF